MTSFHPAGLTVQDREKSKYGMGAGPVPNPLPVMAAGAALALAMIPAVLHAVPEKTVPLAAAPRFSTQDFVQAVRAQDLAQQTAPPVQIRHLSR